MLNCHELFGEKHCSQLQTSKIDNLVKQLITCLHMKMWMGHKSIVFHLKVFGCIAFVLIPIIKKKL
jgi:hypothetical protein